MNLGKTLVIANPVARSGRGGTGVDVLRDCIKKSPGSVESVHLRLTQAMGDARAMAAEAEEYDTVLVLGGDGVIHEAVCGLMDIESARRPRMGVVAMGSGNDFARTLGAPINEPERSLDWLLGREECEISVGHVASDACPEGVYFAETLSFGVDAAIALDTTVRRGRGTAQHGAALFATSSLKKLSHARHAYPCTVSFDGGAAREIETLIFAVQNGPTYGGGFRICPDADPRDTHLDVCYNVKHPSVPVVLGLLGLARFGLHTRTSAVTVEQVERLEIAFEGEHKPPCQVDGEELPGSRFQVRIVPQALRVLM